MGFCTGQMKPSHLLGSYTHDPKTMNTEYCFSDFIPRPMCEAYRKSTLAQFKSAKIPQEKSKLHQPKTFHSCYDESNITNNKSNCPIPL